MSWKDLVDQAKSAVFEEEDEKQPQPPQPPATPPSPAQVVPITSAPILTESAPVVTETPDSEIYQRLVAKTDWENTPVFQAIKKHLAPMKDVKIDPKVKFTIALKQAMEIDGVNPADVTAAFDTAKSNLQTQVDNFKQIAATVMARDVDAKKQKAEELQQQVQQLTREAFDSQAKLQSRERAFDLAAAQRQAEITSKQAEYSSLLS